MYIRLSDEIQFCEVESSISQNPVVWGRGEEWNGCLAWQNGVVIKLPRTVEAAPHCVAGRVRLNDDDDAE